MKGNAFGVHVMQCGNQREIMKHNGQEMSLTGYHTATFGAGCFWCVEAIFQQLIGVIKVTPGYSGGLIKNPSYKEVCNEVTGHAEVCQVIFDANIISYDELLEVFFLIHDPTTPNRQGPDKGNQYRSVIFYHNEEQKEMAEEYKEMINDMNLYENPIITEISPFTAFYKAEDYHQHYYESNREVPYCTNTITPKLMKFRMVFWDKLKPEMIFNN